MRSIRRHSVAVTFTPRSKSRSNSGTTGDPARAAASPSAVQCGRCPTCCSWLPGDVVVCEHGVQPRQSDLVAALIDGASVFRVWSMQSGRPVLRSPDGQTPPENAEDLVIQGVAVQVVRSRVREGLGGDALACPGPSCFGLAVAGRPATPPPCSLSPHLTRSHSPR
jgi:hypothetical protein